MSAAETLEWPKEGNARVPYRVFADPDIYRAELERVFLGPTWQYLAIADELPLGPRNDHGAPQLLMEAPLQVFQPGQ